LSKDQEQYRQNGMGSVFGDDKLKPRHAMVHHPRQEGEQKKKETNLIQLITQVYWVDIIALQVGEHDDLSEEQGN
jgi:hypothetical protein